MDLRCVTPGYGPSYYRECLAEVGEIEVRVLGEINVFYSLFYRFWSSSYHSSHIDLKACESRGLLGTSIKVTPNLRGVPLERLSNVKFDKIVLCFVDCFPKAAEAVNGKMTD